MTSCTTRSLNSFFISFTITCFVLEEHCKIKTLLLIRFQFACLISDWVLINVEDKAYIWIKLMTAFTLNIWFKQNSDIYFVHYGTIYFTINITKYSEHNSKSIIFLVNVVLLLQKVLYLRLKWTFTYGEKIRDVKHKYVIALFKVIWNFKIKKIDADVCITKWLILMMKLFKEISLICSIFEEIYFFIC